MEYIYTEDGVRVESLWVELEKVRRRVKYLRVCVIYCLTLPRKLLSIY